MFGEDAVRVVAALASQTSVAVENARLYQHLRAERDRLISLEAVTRQDLARDLHDGLVQRLAWMAMNIEVIKTLLFKDTDRALHELGELDQLGRLTIKEARTPCEPAGDDLMPAALTFLVLLADDCEAMGNGGNGPRFNVAAALVMALVVVAGERGRGSFVINVTVKPL